ncbi:RNA 3'-terminal phosphate cyclase [Halobium salinum]|uniref:RNA 3'-terminal phosphate cyclase n=1 Tax=Halobium salinum TaxID=1364940 RepID=A0ABD5PAA9_9EURY|nr:RNA 3'-terminal phosphate cyclase [Halobium salinum]
MVDGTAGGGQLLRTALSLAAVTGDPFEMTGVRAERPEPGLKPQHLAAVETLADLTDAEVDGAEVGSTEVTFDPGPIRGGAFEASMGTAGSLTLLFDAALPAAVRLDEPLTLHATGGTDVKWSPPVESLRSVKLPLLGRYGLDAGVDLHRTGYYPAGGGAATLRLEPSDGRPLELVDRGDLDRVEVVSKASEELEGAEVADRQAARAEERLVDAGLPVEVRSPEYVPTKSTGSTLVLRGVYDGSLVGVDELGERGRPSETVADRAVDRFLSLHASGAPVDEHVADQLLVFLALWGGQVSIPRVTAHVESNLDVLAAFGCEVELDDSGEQLLLAVSPHRTVE